mmetsp:Transcript_24147/g.52756  ORF Transcript_24147/g.52756 Transcript_24147/m.52756 type:complete len:106 (+) Transcript_24147:1280-1597(+)
MAAQRGQALAALVPHPSEQEPGGSVPLLSELHVSRARWEDWPHAYAAGAGSSSTSCTADLHGAGRASYKKWACAASFFSMHKCLLITGLFKNGNVAYRHPCMVES